MQKVPFFGVSRKSVFAKPIQIGSKLRGRLLGKIKEAKKIFSPKAFQMAETGTFRNFDFRDFRISRLKNPGPVPGKWEKIFDFLTRGKKSPNLFTGYLGAV